MRPQPTARFLCLAIFSLLFACSTAPRQQDVPPSETEAGSNTEAGSQPVEGKSVKPGINKRFKDPALDMKWAVKVFEGESREIFVERAAIAEALKLASGESVADIGSGTGLFLPWFTEAVGAEGKVYAVEIAPKFIDHIQGLAKENGWSQVETVFCTDKSTELGSATIDAAFVCDTYHHFEYPMATLASIHQAMKPGGRLVIVDFERIPGRSREWVLGHVRCNKETVIKEVTAAGFVFLDEVEVKGLLENYLIRFTRP